MNKYDSFEQNLCELKTEDRAADNKGFCNIGADGITMGICNSMWHLFGQTSFNLAFCCYLPHQFFNWASVPGGRFSNSPTSQSPVRCLQAYMRPRNFITTFTILQVGLLIMIYLIDQKKSNWVCGPALLFLGFLLLLIQLTFTFAGWTRTFDKIGKTITIISGTILVFFIISFINFLTKCS